jgi:ribonucleotide monophosphatase NagD (HAD superfamily)
MSYYGIGDNPRSDIRGANAAGENWKSILVRTGVYNDNNIQDKLDIENSSDKPSIILDNVLKAVEWIIETNTQT